MMQFNLGHYAERFKDKSVAEIRAERDALYQAILEYEIKGPDPDDWLVCPPPEGVYQQELRYLAEISQLLASKVES